MYFHVYCRRNQKGFKIFYHKKLLDTVAGLISLPILNEVLKSLSEKSYQFINLIWAKERDI